MRSALVLNATFEPLSVVSARRAICLVLADKAEIVEDDGTELWAPALSRFARTVHHVAQLGLGSFGSPSTISPMMLR
ncbi:MAG: hypothetical protein ACKOAT_12575 [Actinomycetota bacterium]